MHRTITPRPWLLALAGFVLIGPGCGQEEGGRCQVDSDCASGLECQDGTTGNGRCEKPGTNGNTDAAADLAPASGPETQVPRIDVGPDRPDVPSPGIDAPPLSLDGGVDMSLADALVSAVDSGVPEIDAASAIDVQAPIDVQRVVDADAIDTRRID